MHNSICLGPSARLYCTVARIAHSLPLFFHAGTSDLTFLCASK